MADEPEQIGELTYVPNPNYPYPFEVERPPHFWMTEQSGRLEAAVEAYLDGELLTPVALDLIKQYLRQYLERALMAGDANRGALLRRLNTLRSSADIERLAEELSEYGVEPF
ncbi:MAG TPA: hypothetical protein VFO07_20150 [Roseiflexaceae bacterium]|nr:hypothetical protein [Roseiflexaceae bacterium]